MTIDRLGPVDPVGKLNKSQKTDKVSRQGKADSINVSSEAKRSEEMYRITEAVKAVPDIRADKVAEAKAKLQDPEYIKKAVDDVAGSILDIFGI